MWPRGPTDFAGERWRTPNFRETTVSSRISGTTSYHHFDAIGSTRQLTSSSASITDTMIYDAWGNVAARTGATQCSPLWVGEVGYYSDKQRDVVYIRARIFAPKVARWGSVDPVDLNGEFIPFIYSNSSPILQMRARSSTVANFNAAVDTVNGFIAQAETRITFAALQGRRAASNIRLRVNPYGYSINNPMTFIDASGLQAERSCPPADAYRKNGECTITAHLLCRQMPADPTRLFDHCFLAFYDAGAGQYVTTINGQRDEVTGKTVFGDDYWDLAPANSGWAYDDAGRLSAVRVCEEPSALGKCKDPCEYLNCLCKAATAISGRYDYNQYTDNSNTFLTRVITTCGGAANFPFRAFGSDDINVGAIPSNFAGMCFQPANDAKPPNNPTKQKPPKPFGV
jgi:RHS repeat-associated protein